VPIAARPTFSRPSAWDGLLTYQPLGKENAIRAINAAAAGEAITV